MKRRKGTKFLVADAGSGDSRLENLDRDLEK